MTFLHPQSFGAGLLGRPDYHLLPDADYRSLKVVWGANYVLELALARLKKRMYLDQFLLLALRTLAALALVIAFARPASYAKTGGPVRLGRASCAARRCVVQHARRRSGAFALGSALVRP